MQAILFAVISYFCWGSGDIFGTIASRKIGGVQTAFWFMAVLIPFYLIICLLFPAGLENLTPGIFSLTLLLSVIAAASMITFYESLRLSASTLVGSITASFPIVVVPLSIIFLGEKITSFQALTIAIILFGVIFSTLNIKDLKKEGLKMEKGIFLAIITMLLWGVYWTFIKVPVQHIGWAWPNLLTITAAMIIAMFMRYRKIPIELKTITKIPLPLILNSLLIGSGTLAFSYAISIGGNVAIITPIAGSYSTLYAVLSYFIFKDKMTKREIIGVVITLLGIVALAFSTTLA